MPQPRLTLTTPIAAKPAQEPAGVGMPRARDHWAGRTSNVKHCAVALRTCKYATSGWLMTDSTAAW